MIKKSSKIILKSITAVCICFALLLLFEKANKSLYRPRTLWNIALFQLDSTDNVIEHDYSKPDCHITPKKLIRTSLNQTTGYADPFLFVKDGWLYLFFEKEIYGENGVINCMRTKDLKKWEDFGTVLKQDVHLSYPNVFEIDSDIYMIPETSKWDEIGLYKSSDFPREWKKVKVLASGEYFVDSDVFEKDGKYYLFTSVWHHAKQGLRIYEADSLKGNYILHPQSPNDSTSDYLRCGGAIIEIDNLFYRPAQYCHESYGENLGLFQVDSISEGVYKEHFVRHMNERSYFWSEKGGHHFNMVEFNGKIIVAMDGKQKDNWINNRTRKFFENQE